MVWPSYPVKDGMDLRDGHVDKDVYEEYPAPNWFQHPAENNAIKSMALYMVY